MGEFSNVVRHIGNIFFLLVNHHKTILRVFVFEASSDKNGVLMDMLSDAVLHVIDLRPGDFSVPKDVNLQVLSRFDGLQDTICD